MCLNCGYLFMDSNDRIYSKCPECASGDLDSYSFKMEVDDDGLPLMDKQLMKEKDTKEKARLAFRRVGVTLVLRRFYK